MHTEIIFTETEGHKGRTTLDDHGRRVAAQIAEQCGPGPVRVQSSSLATTAWEDYNIRYSSVTVVGVGRTSDP